MHGLLSVSKVVQRPSLVDDTHGGLLRPNTDTLDVVTGLTHCSQFSIDNVRGFYGGLGVELGGVGDLEKDILHDVGRVRRLELKGLSLRYWTSR